MSENKIDSDSLSATMKEKKTIALAWIETMKCGPEGGKERECRRKKKKTDKTPCNWESSDKPNGEANEHVNMNNCTQNNKAVYTVFSIYMKDVTLFPCKL